MALGDIFQVRVYQRFHGEECLNVFYYKQAVVGAGDAEDLLGGFQDDVWDYVRDMQSARVLTHRYEVINGMDNGDFSISDASATGNYDTGLDIPPQGAYAFRSPSAGPGTRYAYKRFVGCMTGALASVGNPVWSTGFLEGWMHYTGVALGALVEATASAYLPIQITGGFQLGVAPTESHQVFGQWAANSWMSTQRTRAQFAWVLPEAPG